MSTLEQRIIEGAYKILSDQAHREAREEGPEVVV